MTPIHGYRSEQKIELRGTEQSATTTAGQYWQQIKRWEQEGRINQYEAIKLLYNSGARGANL